MIGTLLLGSFSVLFAYIAGRRKTRWGLKTCFTLIFLFLGLRYNFGNDYQAYLDSFHGLTDLSLGFEPGWTYVARLFEPLGFFTMIAVLALINCVVYYRFIKKYLPPRLYWLAVFLYVFNPDFMLVHSSAMRQSVAIMLFVYSLDYLYKKDAFRYFACIGLASLFHFSALILFPVYLIGLFDWRIDRFRALILVSVFAAMFVFGGVLSNYLTRFVGAYFTKYSVYQDAGVVRSGLGFLYLSAMFALTLSFQKLQPRQTAIMFDIAIIGFLLMPLTLLIELSARVGMYFAPATIVTYPVILRNLRNPLTKGIYLTLLLGFVAYKFVTFFYSDTWRGAFGTYQTIFSAGQWY